MAASVDNNTVSAHEDPSVTKQYDRETPYSEQLKDFYELADKNRISLLITDRKGQTVSRAMAVSDIRSNPAVNITFFNNSDMSWVSISGTATVSQNDPRIREYYSPVVSAWFGDMGDGVHSGNADDPRMSLLSVKTERVSYYMSTSGKLTRMAEMAKAVAMGQVAQTGVLRELTGDVLEGARAGK
ncbi:Protein bli-3 [Taphrina deformans PYCC 5710]|uniref:Protein bli-3 n=1 Tax=Taphrina deformans (strain PYCC 5710 / ATCC 11124 / CBS 356.35 / IMI 108563 / JCM 9778 / NBRC 8474) TaxID=1097556 RepID=R4XAF4_TAPDE|nr:Protein bli-3 [Taphrina deformans PYCC 5710]|eukprot:CCG82487.1 Protein bli-3 [Taphrina deformans PYCC 5710]